ncbi:MAG: DUF4382 domain-containing protein [Fimbriimonadaceae bacterium]
MRLWMADAPLPNVTSLVITIDRIEAHHDGQWVEIEAESQTIDLLNLTQQAMVVADAGLPAGQFNQVRLFISSAVVTDDTGTHNVTVPSAAQTGLKVNINGTVEPNTFTAVLLDFNVEKSLILQGNGQYLLQPVIPAVLMDLAGTVTGSVTLNGEPVHGALVRAIYTAGPNYAPGTEVNTSATAEDGTFKVWALLEGTYTIEASFTDAADVEYAASIENVVVTRGNNTAVGVIALVAVP